MAQEEYEEKDLRTHIFETTDTYAGSDQMITAPLANMKEDDNIIMHCQSRREEYTDFETKTLVRIPMQILLAQNMRLQTHFRISAK